VCGISKDIVCKSPILNVVVRCMIGGARNLEDFFFQVVLPHYR